MEAQDTASTVSDKRYRFSIVSAGAATPTARRRSGPGSIPSNSYLALETAGSDRERTLADLADAASFIGAGSERIELLTPTTPTEGALKAGALVAQGFALRMPDSGIAVRHRLADTQALAGRNGKVVIGTADKIRGIHGIGDLAAIWPISRVPISACVRSRAPVRS